MPIGRVECLAAPREGVMTKLMWPDHSSSNGGARILLDTPYLGMACRAWMGRKDVRLRWPSKSQPVALASKKGIPLSVVASIDIDHPHATATSRPMGASNCR